MENTYAYLTLNSDLATSEQLQEILSRHKTVLDETGGRKIEMDEVLSPKFLLYFIASGGSEQLFLDIYKKRSESFPNEPVYLIAHASNNSLPASLEILAKIRQERIKGKIIYLSGNVENDILLLKGSVRNLTVYKKFISSRMGLVGKPSDWLVASAPELNLVKESWGIEILEYQISEVRELYKKVKDEDIKVNLEKFTSGAGTIFEPSSDEVKNSVKIYSAIKELSVKHKLSSISVRCFDLLVDEKTTGCFALSQLTDEGIIAGCEGDIVTNIGLVWVYEMFQKFPWMANPAQIDVNNNRLILAHCTVPRNIVTEYDIRSHFESGIGVGIQGKITKGPVTLLRLGGKDLKSIWLAEGEIVENGKEENLCRTQVEIRIHDRNKLKELLTNPLGNHLIMVHGFHAEELEDWHSDFVL